MNAMVKERLSLPAINAKPEKSSAGIARVRDILRELPVEVGAEEELD